MNTEANRLSFYKRGSVIHSITSITRNERESLRRESRLALRTQRRNIAFMSPIDSPALSIPKKPSAKEILANKAKERYEKLIKYKEEKQKKLAEAKKNTKPLFKVSHVNHKSTTDYEKIYKEIKGNPIKYQNTRDYHKLAPSSTYKFKPPDNVKPIHLNSSKFGTKSNAKVKLDFSSFKQNKSVSKNQTASTLSGNHFTIDSIRRSNRLIEKNEARQKELDVKFQESNNLELDVQHCTLPILISNTNEEVITTTPETKPSIIHLSPFVTLSRGKKNARDEFHQRNLSVSSAKKSENSINLKTTASYFYDELGNETQRLEDMCKRWKIYEEEHNPPEGACDMIHVAIGQTELLLKKKFKKFSELIELYRSNNSEQKVESFDLHGFWDIILQQIRNLDQRFETLNKLQINNWEEILPSPVKKVAKITKKIKKKEVKSKLKDLIKEAREKNLRSKEADSTKILLRIENLIENEEKTPVLSAKMGTPKSILKSNRRLRSSTKRSKSVLFLDVLDKENQCNSPNLIEFSPAQCN
ncbi:hypothetical protein FQA39_LY01323 [Lamprigera yunnana]|nr:hypothetical protein FQA39_LY01323 [Lamprigera yunnana]